MAHIRRKPLRYIPLASTFTAVIAMLTRYTGDRTDEELAPIDIAQLGLATYTVSRVVAKEKAGAFIREPFVEPRDEQADEVDPDQQRPAGNGVRAALGELLLCTRCIGMWVAAALTFFRLLWPRESKIVMPLLSAAAVNNLLQAGHATLANVANALDEDDRRRRAGHR